MPMWRCEVNFMIVILPCSLIVGCAMFVHRAAGKLALNRARWGSLQVCRNCLQYIETYRLLALSIDIQFHNLLI
ncbi:hypothetical protein BDZ91DRAFT_61970 [Kalaharituber pfeilii]|nr:hypothetical protein BDZ91DRAFT_61970 [Kalaharituber pfeilii]